MTPQHPSVSLCLRASVFLFSSLRLCLNGLPTIKRPTGTKRVEAVRSGEAGRGAGTAQVVVQVVNGLPRSKRPSGTKRGGGVRGAPPILVGLAP